MSYNIDLIDFERIFFLETPLNVELKEIEFVVRGMDNREWIAHHKGDLDEESRVFVYEYEEREVFHFEILDEDYDFFTERIGQLIKIYLETATMDHIIESQMIVSRDIDQIIEKALFSGNTIENVLGEWFIRVRSFIPFKSATLYICGERFGSLQKEYEYQGGKGLSIERSGVLPSDSIETISCLNKKIYIQDKKHLFFPLYYQEIPLGTLVFHEKINGEFDDLDLKFLNQYSVAITHLLFQRRLKKKIQRTSQFNEDVKFYISNQIYREIIDDRKGRDFESKKQHVVCLFADIRSFTSISEKLEPSVLVDLLNIYFDHMTPIIEEHQGTIDKFVGDMVAAFWNAPKEIQNPEVMAVKAALKMQKAMVNKVVPHWVEAGIRHVGIGIGIASGNGLVGHMGSDTFKNYTVFGPVAKEAEHLESLARPAEVRVSHACFQKAKDKLPTPTKKEVFRTKSGKKSEIAVFKAIDYPDYTKMS